MKNISNKQQLKRLESYPKEILELIGSTIEILDNNYEANRNVDNDLGGYVVVAENILDTEILKQDKLQGLVPEYTDVIECSEGVNWTSSLFLLSSDFAIVVITTEELSNFLIE